jgi:predicted transcriptional regulator
MTGEKSFAELVESLEQSFDDILDMTKAIGNDKRLRIITALLIGAKTFDALKEETKLQKTALSNHLAILLQQGIIEKPEHGTYQATNDGKLFVQAIENAYAKSDFWKKKQAKTPQVRQFSDTFIGAFFKNR